MKKFVTAAVLAASVSVGGVGIGTLNVEAAGPAADAFLAPSVRPAIRRAARIVTMERVYGSNYRIYKARYPRALDWDNNGCSVPFSVPITDFYRGVFQKSCDRHDFGYRNHGKSGYDRLSVDNRFKSNMQYQCVVRYDDPWDLPARALCYVAADKFYDAVRLFGGGSW
ncbi:MAG: hypothetical protein H0U21_09680 [Acidimicrobiia bacterium]|nr:hypothetical protein [Acidimicrobiia bacterium]